jgi:hypothetical protein
MKRQNWSDDSMTVEITVTITKDVQGAYQPGETLTYGQKFEIPARGFGHVAEILGKLDSAVGSIEKYKPREGA